MIDRWRPCIQLSMDRKTAYADMELAREGAYMRVSDYEAIIKRQAAAALSGMDAAKAISSRQLELARQARAESAPEALESERAANAQLTQELSLAEEGLANAMQEVEHLRAYQQQMNGILIENATLRNELTAARLERDNLRNFLAGARRKHYCCEDSWYSCSQEENGCADDRRRGQQCDCGADAFNAQIDKLLSEPQDGKQ